MTSPAQPEVKKPAAMWRRLLPLALLLALIIAAFASGIGSYISFDEIALRYAVLAGWVGTNPVLAIMVAMAIYTVATALSFPAAWLLTVATGLIMGWALATAAVVIGATLGASILFFATRLALADFFRARAGAVLNRMADGFRSDATSYMLFLRLAPVFPFTLVNVVPAILGVPFRIFFFTTFVGIIPGSLAYTYAGEGLRSIVEERAIACAANVPPCGEALTARDLVTPEIIIAFALLAAVSLLPVVLKRLRPTR